MSVTIRSHIVEYQGSYINLYTVEKFSHEKIENVTIVGGPKTQWVLYKKFILRNIGCTDIAICTIKEGTKDFDKITKFICRPKSRHK